jgi:hypothetical protein
MIALLLAMAQEEETLRKMEERLLKAKTFQVAFKAEGTIRFGPEKRELKAEGTLRLKGAKFRLDQKMDGAAVTIASDGERVVSRAGDEREERKPMKDCGGRFAVLFARLGLMTSAWISVENPDRDPYTEDEEYLPDLRKLVSYSDTTSAGERAIRCTMTYRKRGEEADSTAVVTVWLDEKGLPSKRRTEHTAGVRRVVAEETYSDWKLDGEIGDEVFKP